MSRFPINYAMTLAAGRYGQEGRLPSEAQLARQFSVSRPTVARALQSLVEAGLVERRAGSGTFAKPGDIKRQASYHPRTCVADARSW